MLDLGRTLLGAVEREPTALAIVDGTIRRKYGDWFEEIRAAAGGLISRGLEPGDRCLILMKNSWQMATIYWACQLACIVATPINWRLKTRDVKFFVEDSMAKGIVFEDSTASVAEASSSVGMLGISASGSGKSSFLDLCASEPIEREGLAGPDDLSVMLYTSGTTGVGKGVPRRHRAERAAAVAHIAQNGYQRCERTLGVMPLYHTMGLRSLISMALVNGCFVCQSRFEPVASMELIQSEKITSLYLVPTLYHDLLNGTSRDSYDISTVERIGFAGAPMQPELVSDVDKYFQPKIFVNHYGSSEIYTFTIEPDAALRPGSAGKAGINGRVKVVALGATTVEEEVPSGTQGEIVASLDNDEAFEGYWKRPEATQTAIRDGWYFSGDVGYFDAVGNLHITGRVDDMILTGGENVLPLEIEQILLRHPAIMDVAVAGVLDDRLGQKVAAFVQTCDEVTEDDLDRFCSSSPLAQFKRPRVYVFVEEVPRSPAGKILRRSLLAADFDAGG